MKPRMIKIEICKRWLVDLLSAGDPIKPSDVVALGREVGFSRGTIYRVRRDLGVLIADTEGRQDPRNCWQLKGDLIELDEEPQEEVRYEIARVQVCDVCRGEARGCEKCAGSGELRTWVDLRIALRDYAGLGD